MIQTNVTLVDVDAAGIRDIHKHVQQSQNAFLLCTAGSVTLRMDRKNFTLHPGDLFLFPAYSQITVDEFSDNVQGVCGVADFEIVLKALEAVSDMSHLSQIRLRPVVSLTEQQYARISRMIECVRQRRTEETVFGTSIVLAMICVLLYELMDAYVTNSPHESCAMSRADSVFLRFLSLLSRDFRAQREVSYYASGLGLTPRYFATIIRDKSGISPGAWISRFVIAEAKTMLGNPDVSVKQVAAALNFPNQSFFGRYFRQNTGMSPGEYRKSSLKG